MATVFERLRKIPNGQKYRYLLITLSCLLFFAPLALIPALANNPDLCGPLCMRRFYLIFPGMDTADLMNQIRVAWIGVMALGGILLVTLFFGRIWCAYLCPVGGFPELVSRMLGNRWKIEFRWLPQVQIRYGYFITYLVLMPAIGISACTLCNFITVPRIFQALSGDWRGVAFLVTTVGMVNLALLFILGFFASKGRAYCQFLCPIGAIDALVNRLAARFRFVRRIRVERNRCTGCSECARKCMTGAIRIVDQVAVVDQLSCMSCHECADVCDWGAIDWLAVPPEIEHKRQKKGVDFYPNPEWVSLHRPVKLDPQKKGRWRYGIWGVMLVAGLFVFGGEPKAAPRQADPDGCLSCHALPDLRYLDEQGIERNATIDSKHYLGSLHGSVACSDCHREIRYFPHDEKNGAVDCSASCHLDEPSAGEAYSHKQVAEEVEQSVHGEGAWKGFTGGNRLEESDQDYPSCRRCHSNSSYIAPEKLAEFDAMFQHSDEECGKCHQGEAWRDRFAGHFLRRFMGGQFSKREVNRVCNECHADREMMAEVERKAGREQPEPATTRFVQASGSYAASLHGRLIEVDRESGASCIDCHAPKGLRHGVEADESPTAATHGDQLAETCGAEGCHGYAGHPSNEGFLTTDMHDLDLAPLMPWERWRAGIEFDSPWVRALMILGTLSSGMTLYWLLGVLFGRLPKGKIYAAIGGETFKRRMLFLPDTPRREREARDED